MRKATPEEREQLGLSPEGERGLAVRSRSSSALSTFGAMRDRLRAVKEDPLEAAEFGSLVADYFDSAFRVFEWLGKPRKPRPQVPMKALSCPKGHITYAPAEDTSSRFCGQCGQTLTEWVPSPRT